MIERKYENEAHILSEAIKKLASNERALDNFEDYLSLHFDTWIEKYASYPSGMASEFESFSKMYEDEDV